MHLSTLVEMLEQEIGVSDSERSKLADLLAERGGGKRVVARGKLDGRTAGKTRLAKPGR